MSAKLTDNAEHPNSSTSQPKKATDTTASGETFCYWNTGGKATTKDLLKLPIQIQSGIT